MESEAATLPVDEAPFKKMLALAVEPNMTRPRASIVKMLTPVDDARENSGKVVVPTTESDAEGVEEENPADPFISIVSL